MTEVTLLDPSDTIEGDDWCRPLSLFTESPQGDYYAFTSCYSGKPQNNLKWVRVKDVFGSCWIGKTVAELNTALIRYELLRGNIPKENQLIFTGVNND